MKEMLFGCLLLVATSFSPDAYAVRAGAASPTRVEVLFMNHGPLMDTLDKMKGVFSACGDRIRVSWYDFESKEGEDFKAQKGINRHVPLVIWIDGNEVLEVGQKRIEFVGFPTGAGPAFFQGNWTMEDLKTALDQAIAQQ